jgi:UDP-glucose 4-epimerase
VRRPNRLLRPTDAPRFTLCSTIAPGRRDWSWRPSEPGPRIEVRVLVTGATGFVGRHLVRRLLAEGHEVTVLHRPASSPPEGLRAVAVDLVDLVPDDLSGPLDAVVHLAARLDNPFGVDRTLAELAAPNVLGTLRLLEAAAAVGIGRFLHASTGGVGSNPQPGGRMFEHDPAGPINPYGLTKHLAEQAVQAYAWPFERVSLRYFAPYGRDGSNPMFRHHLESLERGEPIDVGAGGTPEINPIHVDDAVAATVRALDAQALPSVINIAGAEVATMARLVDLLGRAVGRAPLIRERSEPAPSWVADIERMSRHLGPPRIGLEEGIQREFGSG